MASEHVYDPRALERPLAGTLAPAEREIDGRLRPTTFAEFVGQLRTVDNLRVAIAAARERGEPLDHLLLSGPPGLGKTSLGRIVAHELGGRLHSTSGPALERPRDLVGILTQLERGDVLFVDEIHRVPAPVEEFLYTAMEDFTVDFTLDQGPHARVLPLAIAPFTLVGATTREGLLSAPFRGRFGHLERLEPYPVEDLVAILARSAEILAVDLDPEAAHLIGVRSRGTPRVANRFLRRARDLAQVTRGSRAPAGSRATAGSKATGGRARPGARAAVRADVAAEALARLGVDENGLEEMDRRILACLAQGAGEPVGLKTIAAAVEEAEDTIEDVFEPHLLRQGYIQRTARGRTVTDRGRAAIGMAPDDASARRERGLFG